ncbi:MAG: hypothetical protein WDM87_09705 [Terracidiphilus sp.]
MSALLQPLTVGMDRTKRAARDASLDMGMERVDVGEKLIIVECPIGALQNSCRVMRSDDLIAILTRLAAWSCDSPGCAGSSSTEKTYHGAALVPTDTASPKLGLTIFRVALIVDA